jgi:hypothetical protein
MLEGWWRQQRIARHLHNADLPSAVAALKTNWTNGMERMLARIPDAS